MTRAVESQSVHESIFRTLLQTPHRNYDEVLTLHKAQFTQDPNFYARLAFWACGLKNNTVRDINEIFLAVLFDSPYREHQELAYVLLQSLPPYQVDRVGNLFTGYDEIVHHPSYEGTLVSNPSIGLTIEPARYGKKHPDPAKRGQIIPPKTAKFGKKSKVKSSLINKGVISRTANEFTVQTLLVHHKYLNNRRYKGMFRHAIKTYLKNREKDTALMEGALLRSRDAIRRFYVRSNTLPQSDANGWINQFLFHNVPPPGSRIEALRLLINETDPIKQAKLISEHKIPYPVASTVVSNMTPTILVALIDVMSPQELMSNLSSLQARGAMDNADIKSLIETKLTKAKKAKRIDALKGSQAADSVANLDENIKKMVKEVSDIQLKRHGQIQLKTAILIDKSGSMSNAIELGKQISATVAQSCVEGNEPIVYLFDSQPIEIKWEKKDGDITTKTAWDKRLKTFTANGGTAPGQVVRAMIRSKQYVDQIVLITDEGENFDTQSFAAMLKDYQKSMNILPSVIIVRIGNLTQMEQSCKAQGIETTVLITDAHKTDFVAMPNLLQLLSRKGLFDIVQEILSLSLPTKEEYDSQNS